jgi:hypothetical protein
MGYGMSQTDSSFFIAKKDRTKVKAAIKALMSGVGATREGKYRWVDTATVLDARTVDEQFEEWRWSTEYDDSGNIVDLVHEGEKMGDDIELFKAIAPHVKPGSYIDMMGEDGNDWRWYFDGVTCLMRDPE